MAAPSIAIKLVEAASLLMLGAVLLAVLDDRLRQGWRRNVVVGLCLAVSALASMADPLVWRPGFVLDARAAAIALSAPFGGPVATIVVVVRDGAPQVARGSPGVQVLQSRRVDVSSTELRARVRDGRTIRGFVPDAVADYIAEHRLYR